MKMFSIALVALSLTTAALAQDPLQCRIITEGWKVTNQATSKAIGGPGAYFDSKEQCELAIKNSFVTASGKQAICTNNSVTKEGRAFDAKTNKLLSIFNSFQACLESSDEIYEF